MICAAATRWLCITSTSYSVSPHPSDVLYGGAGDPPLQCATLAVAPQPGGELICAMKANKNNPPGIVKAVKNQLEIDPILNFLGWLTHNPKKQRLDWYLDFEIANIAAQHAAIGATSGEALFLVLHRVATDPVLEAGKEVAQAVSQAIAGTFTPLARAGPASGGLHKNILDAHHYDIDYAQAGDSAEFHFDAAAGVYISTSSTIWSRPWRGNIFPCSATSEFDFFGCRQH